MYLTPFNSLSPEATHRSKTSISIGPMHLSIHEPTNTAPKATSEPPYYQQNTSKHVLFPDRNRGG